MFINTLKQFLRKATFLTAAGAIIFATAMVTSVDARAGDIDIDRASWSNDRDRLTVRGDNARDNDTVTIRYGKKEDNGVVIGTTQADGDGDWEFRISAIDPVPCDVTAVDSRDDDDKEVRRAPRDCSNDGGAPPAAQCNDGIDNDGDGLTDFPADPGCTDVNDNDEFNAPPQQDAQCNDGLDNDGDGLTDFPADPGCTDVNDNDEFNAPPQQDVQCNDGIDNDNDGLTDFPADPGCVDANDNDEIDPVAVNCTPLTGKSINSTSQTGCAEQDVPEVATLLNGNFRVLAINDLGMHCGDYDTRISSILPPFQVLLGQVIQRGATPTLNPEGVSLSYSATSNSQDPVLNRIGAIRGLNDDGTTYKTNFWDAVAGGAYDPFYPAIVTPLLNGPFPVIADIGLPVPNVEELYIGADGVVNSGDETLSAVQHTMPGLNNPYCPQRSKDGQRALWRQALLR